jgi:predicted amidohydrolase
VDPLLQRAREAGVALHIGYAEKDGARRFNSSIYVDGDGTVLGTYRKIHLPGVSKPDGYAKVYEPYFFETGDTGFRVFEGARARVGIAICQDRRYGESFRCLGLLGSEIVISGYNTPAYPLALAHNELSLRAGAYQNSLFVIGVAHCGVEDGLELIAGSCIVDPLGEIVAKASTSADELLAARIDLDVMVPTRKRWNFFGRRRPEHYGLLTRPVH